MLQNNRSTNYFQYNKVSSACIFKFIIIIIFAFTENEMPNTLSLSLSFSGSRYALLFQIMLVILNYIIVAALLCLQNVVLFDDRVASLISH